MQYSIQSNYLSKQTTNCLKFIFAIAVVICHLFSYQPFGKGMGIGMIITAFGYLSVSCFLFFSGYGLTISYMNKGNEYFNGYLKKRILPIYVIQVILIIIYTLFNLLVEGKVDYKQVVMSFFFGNTIIQYGWYIQMIIVFYLIYYLVFKKQTVKRGIIRLAYSLLIYCLVCVTLKLSNTWYETSFSFLLGAIWAHKKQAIDNKMSERKNYIFSLIVGCVGFSCSFIFGNANILPNSVKIIVKMISSVLFVILVLLVVMKIKIDYKPMVYAGNFYFEIYFLQGIFLILFNEIFLIENIVLRYVVCISSICITAVLINPVVKWMTNKCKG